ncbi:MAG: hypothetical protein QOJ99_5718 [Bryobacterales bacterium]|nr:hypothetical protein [Bryobacterales bacterium]
MVIRCNAGADQSYKINVIHAYIVTNAIWLRSWCSVSPQGASLERQAEFHAAFPGHGMRDIARPRTAR